MISVDGEPWELFVPGPSILLDFLPKIKFSNQVRYRFLQLIVTLSGPKKFLYLVT